MEKKVFFYWEGYCARVYGGVLEAKDTNIKIGGKKKEKKGPNSLWSIRKIYAYHCKYIRQKWGNVFFDTGQPHTQKKIKRWSPKSTQLFPLFFSCCSASLLLFFSTSGPHLIRVDPSGPFCVGPIRGALTHRRVRFIPTNVFTFLRLDNVLKATKRPKRKEPYIFIWTTGLTFGVQVE